MPRQKFHDPKKGGKDANKFVAAHGKKEQKSEQISKNDPNYVSDEVS